MRSHDGFKRHARQTPHRRPARERAKDWNEMYEEFPAAAVSTQGARCMDCGVPFCQSPSGCPVENLIPDWNELAARGRWREALDRLHSTNNFPEFTGRLCPAPCESACVLGINSEPVAIRAIEQSLIDRGFAEGWVTPIKPARLTGRKVAVVGSGPAGLAAAQQLARKGHSVTVFEKAAKVGGLLRYGIPDFKMEKSLIDRRVRQMEDEGVIFKTSTCVGRDIAFERMRRDFDAICLAIGAEQPRDLEVPGRELQGVHFAMDYLIAQNRVLGGEIQGPSPISAHGKHVIILGGGDTGSDCLGTAIRQGAASVTQIELLPEPPPTRSSHTPWPQWPHQLRSSHAHEEGGSRHWSLMTKALIGDNGHVRKLIADQVVFTDSRTPTPTTVVREFDADLVILAMGFTGPRLEPLLGQIGIARDRRGNVATDAGFMTSLPGVFAGGDARRGAWLIVGAIHEGRKMAEAVDAYVMQHATAQTPSQSVSAL